jgi:hypothetical protein
MRSLASVDLIAETWRALRAPIIPCRLSVVEQLSSKFLKQGWADIGDIQDMIWAMEGRFADCKIGDMVRALGIPMRATYPRPRYGQHQCIGAQTLEAADVAWLLILMERLGFEVEPMVMVGPLAERLKKRTRLNDAELSVIWYKKEHHKNAPVGLFADPKLIGHELDEITTRASYRIEFWKDRNGQPTTLQSFAPKYRPSHH